MQRAMNKAKVPTDVVLSSQNLSPLTVVVLLDALTHCLLDFFRCCDSSLRLWPATVASDFTEV